MLKIKPSFKAPKTPPSILFTTPNEAKSAIFVNNFPSKAIIKTIMAKVMANETMVMYFSSHSTFPAKKLPTK